MQDNYLLKLSIVIGDLSTYASKFRKYYFREVVESRFATTSFVKGYNPRTYYYIASEPDFILCKNTLHVVLA